MKSELALYISLSFTPLGGASTIIDAITEITPPPAAVSELKAKIGSGAKAGVEIVSRLPHGVVPKVGILGRKQ